MEEKRVLVTVGGRIERSRDGEKKSSWWCKFDLNDPNVWIQLVLLLVVIGLGASTIVLATNQESPSPPPPNPFNALNCDDWNKTLTPLPEYTNVGGFSELNKILGVNGFLKTCGFPISNSTATAVGDYMYQSRSGSEDINDITDSHKQMAQ